jgi:hypothetical protein
VSDTRNSAWNFDQSDLRKREKNRQLFHSLTERRQQTLSKNGTVCPNKQHYLSLTPTPTPITSVQLHLSHSEEGQSWNSQTFPTAPPPPPYSLQPVYIADTFLPSFQTFQHPTQPHSVILNIEAVHFYVHNNNKPLLHTVNNQSLHTVNNQSLHTVNNQSQHTTTTTLKPSLESVTKSSVDTKN